jgi:carbon storage regulator
MLVLSRKRGERLVIAGTIEVVVVEVRGDRVRLGVKAPIGVPVHREEIQRRIEQEMAQQDETTPDPQSRFLPECA